MREYVFPCWDDINNINGGCLSNKILKDQLDFKDLTIKLLGEKKRFKRRKKDLWDVIKWYIN
jgi:hypothetical protein